MSHTARPLSITINDFDDIANPLLSAGQAHATVEVGSRLVKMGHNVTVVSSKYPGFKDRTENGLKYYHIGLGSKIVQLNNVVYCLVLPFTTRKNKSDVIIDCFTAPISTLCSQLFTKIPVIGLPTSFEAAEFSKKYHLPFSLIERWGAKTYKFFLPYTEHYAKKMLKYNPNVIYKIVTEGVGPEFFEIKKRAPKHILFLGRFDLYQKGIDLLLAACSSIKNELKIPIVLAGKGSDELIIKELIEKYELEDIVKIVGPAYGKKKNELLADSLFVVFPSRHEGFSLFALEALASATAVLAFNIPGFSWSRSAAVCKISNFDTASYGKKLLELASQPRHTKLLGEKGREYARKFSWDTVAQDWISFIETNLRKV